MLVVETVARIRREHFIKGKTIKEIARDLKVSRNTVRRVLRSGETSFEYEREVQPRPKLGRWTGCGMSQTMRAWRTANAYVRSGQHAKAIYWLSRTQAILDGDRPRRRRLNGTDTGYILTALFVSVLVWIAKG